MDCAQRRHTLNKSFDKRTAAPAFALPEPVQHRLRAVRSDLLQLHKALLDAEQREYEQLNGRVESSGQLFKLVLHHPRFSWLRTFSDLVVTIDEMLEGDEPVTDADVATVIARVRATVTPNESGTQFERRYHGALQSDPGVVIAHGMLAKTLSESD